MRMCGRFTAAFQPSLLAEQFRAEPAAVEGHQPSWNVTPASDVIVVTADSEGARHLRALHWGLVPRWAKDASSRNQMINLRAETVREKKSWKSSLAKRRCIIPVDGFYEWQDMGKGKKKQPLYITAREPQPLALAGLWATWHGSPDSKSGEQDGSGGKDGDGEGLWTCTILTTTPNRLMASIHHRMPVILPPDTWDAWLDPDNTDTDALAALLVPAPDDMLAAWPVDLAVNSPRNNSPELTEPLEGHEPRTVDDLDRKGQRSD
jgi:putative SOS response-associated peptidase YedK